VLNCQSAMNPNSSIRWKYVPRRVQSQRLRTTPSPHMHKLQHSSQLSQIQKVQHEFCHLPILIAATTTQASKINIEYASFRGAECCCIFS